MKDMRILIADDNPGMRGMIRGIVSSFCDEVVECGDGQEAIQVCHAQRPDIVLMDIMMPRMNGIDAAREILSTFPETRIIMVTDYGDQELKELASRVGALGYVEKENLLQLRTVCAASA